MTRLHRDATPLDMAPPRFATSAPPVVTWRTDLLAVAITSAVAIVGGLIATLTAVAIWSWVVLGFGLWLTVVLGFAPFALLAWINLRELADRHRLNRVRISADERMLIGAWLDTNHDGQLEDKELARFLRYVAALYRGEPSTANHAATNYKVSAGTWQSWRNAMITMGLATEIGKQGGPGFELLSATRSKPWDDLEEYIRRNAPLSVRSAASPGMLITTTPAPVRGKRQIEAVSTLGADVDD